MLRLNPDLPVLWTTPHSLQIGSLDKPIEICEVTRGIEVVVRALRKGTPRNTLDALARQSGVSTQRLDELLRELIPAFLPDSDAGSPRITHGAFADVILGGSGDGRGEIEYVLRSDFRISELADVDSETNEDWRSGLADDTVAVIVESFFVPPSSVGGLLRRDVSHLLVSIDERGAWIGPLVIPGKTPCATCIDFARRDTNASWPAIATQLLAQEHPRLTPRLRCRVAEEVFRFLAGPERHNASTRVRVSPDSPSVSVDVVRFHEQCHCRGLTGTVSELAECRGNLIPLPKKS